MAKTLQKSTGVVRTGGCPGPGRPGRMQIKRNQNNNFVRSEQKNEAGRLTPAPGTLARQKERTANYRRKCKWPTPDSLLLFRIVSTIRNYTRDSGLMREITVSGLKYFSSDYTVRQAVET